MQYEQRLITYVQSVHGDIPDYKSPDARPTPIYNYMILNIYSPCPARLVLRVFPVCVILQRYDPIRYRFD